jgi:hypothetical protein
LIRGVNPYFEFIVPPNWCNKGLYNRLSSRACEGSHTSVYFEILRSSGWQEWNALLY